MAAKLFLNPALTDLARDPRALVAYPHAQRTGGVTMRKFVLVATFGESGVYNRHYVADAKPWRKLTDDGLTPYRAWTDLDDYKDIGLSRPVLWLAVLRHPLYRAASLYFYVQRKEGHRDRELANRYTMEEFYRRAARDAPKYYRNVQTSRVGGRADARHALDVIREHYIGVGFTNALGDFAGALCGAFGWPTIELKGKGSDESRYDEVITPAFRDMVLEENAEDLKLFEAVSRGL